MRTLTRTGVLALIAVVFSASALAQYSQPVRVVNTTEQSVPVKDVQASIVTSTRAIMLAGQSYVEAAADVPACPAGTKFLVNGLHVGPEILIGATGIDVTELPRWGVSLPLWQYMGWGAKNVALNLLGNGPQHLSATLPAGQPTVYSTKLQPSIVLLGLAAVSQTR